MYHECPVQTIKIESFLRVRGLCRKWSLELGHVRVSQQRVRRPRNHGEPRARPSTMSSSEAEIFDLDNVSGTESDDYSPPAKKIVSLLFHFS